jgi:hypothetical protein
MGGRLLAFNAGDVTLARLGQPSNQAAELVTSQSWDSLLKTMAVSWLGDSIQNLFTLSNGNVAGTVTGAAKGKLPGQASLFAYAPATMGYDAPDWAAAYDPWRRSDSAVASEFLHIAYYVGSTQSSTSGLDSLSGQVIPYGDTILQTIYGLVGLP